MTKKKGETLAIWVERNTLEKHESDNMNVCDDYEVTKYRDCGKGKKVFDKKGMIKRCLTKKKKKEGEREKNAERDCAFFSKTFLFVK